VEATEATQTSDKLQLGNMILDQDLLKIETTKGIEIDQDLQITEEMIHQDQMTQIEDTKEETIGVLVEVRDQEEIGEMIVEKENHAGTANHLLILPGNVQSQKEIELITEVQEETMTDQTAGKEKDLKLKDQGMMMIMVAV
jgi:hypothetical protein